MEKIIQNNELRCFNEKINILKNVFIVIVVIIIIQNIKDLNMKFIKKKKLKKLIVEIVLL